MAETKMLYFSSVKGRVVSRFGTRDYIGCRKEITRSSQGVVTRRKWVWDTDRVMAIPFEEAVSSLKAYMGAVRRGDLKKRSKADYEKWLTSRAEENEKAEKASKKRGKGKRRPAGTPTALDGGTSDGAGGDGTAEG